MSDWIPLRHLREELFYSKTANVVVTSLLSSITDRAYAVLDRAGIHARIDNVGSTNPTRQTFVLDPAAKDHPFPPDIDLDIITRSPISQQAGEDVLREAYPTGKTNSSNGIPTLYHPFGAFNLTLSVLDEARASREAPNRYANIASPLTQDQALEVRTLKLILQRIGAYGGYNHGFKGVAAEEAVRQFGSADEALRAFGTYGSGRALTLPSPLDGTNLIGRVSPDIWDRLSRAYAIYTQEGRVKGDPFTRDDWIEVHEGSSTITWKIACSPASCGRDGHGVMRGVEHNFARVREARTRHPHLYVMPHQGVIGSTVRHPHTRVFLSIDASGDTDAFNSLDTRLDQLMRQFVED